MVQDNPCLLPSVLHVAPSGSQRSREMAAVLAGADCGVETRPDVYRALAYVGLLGRQTAAIVIVCADRLAADQIEFFELLSRRYKRCSVYVYNDGGSRNSIDLALDHGANELADADALTLVLSCRERGGIEHAPEVADTDDQRIDTNVGETEIGTGIAESADEDQPRGPVRVPWLRYEDVPLRTPPVRPENIQESVNDAPERLLSPEELEALIGRADVDENGTDG